MILPCQMFFLWKVLEFVENNILVWRADIDLVKIFLVPDLWALYWIEGSSTTPQLQGELFIYLSNLTQFNLI